MNMPPTEDMSKLIVIHINGHPDDSISMEFEQAGARKEALKVVLNYVIDMYDRLSDRQLQQGIRVIRFVNSDIKFWLENTTHGQIEEIIDRHEFGGLACIGTSLQRKILQPVIFDKNALAWGKQRQGPRRLQPIERPLLIVVITDGAAAVCIVLDPLCGESRR